MTGTRKLEVIIAGDAKGATQALDSVGKHADGTGSKMGAIGKAAAAGFAIVGAAAVAGASVAINAASDLTETINKSNTVFGQAGAGIEAWANKAASSIGQSKQQALSAAGSFGNMFTQLGIGQQVAAGMSTKMVELASDFASFHNADISEVLAAQEAAFRGEYDAVQRFVPTINAAAVEQKALAMGLKGTSKELTAQDKALATQALLLEGAGAAAGDFARTSDGLANKQRIMSAQFEDLKAKIGTALMPVMATLVDVITTKVIPAIGALGKWISDNKGLVIAAAVGITAAFVAWGVAAAATAIANFTLATSTLAAIAPFVAIGAAVAAVSAAVIWAYQNWDTFRGAVDAVAGFLTGTLWPALQSVAGFITGTLVPVIAAVIGWFVEWAAMVAETAGKIIGKIVEVVTFFATLPGRIGGAISGVVGTISGVFTSALETAKGIVTGGISAVVGFFGGISGAIGRAMSGLASAISSPFTSAFAAIKRLWNSTAGGFGFSIPSWVPGVGGKSFKIPSMHTGGIVPGGRTAEHLRLLQGGEGVFTPEQMRVLGLGMQSGLATASPAPIIVKVDARGAVGIQGSDVERWVVTALNRAQAKAIR